MKTTLERITHNGSRYLNHYSLRANSFVDISLPNGDKLHLYSNEEGNFVSIKVEAWDQKEDISVEKNDFDHEFFTEQSVEILGNYNGNQYTSVEFKALLDKETEDAPSKSKRITLSGNFDYDQYEEEQS